MPSMALPISSTKTRIAEESSDGMDDIAGGARFHTRAFQLRPTLQRKHLAHGGRQHDRLAERLDQRVDRAPAGAMSRDDKVQLELRQVPHRVRNDGFSRAGQVEAAHDGVKPY